MSTDTEDLVVIFLRREQAVYVMVAHLVENEWLFSWPAETGESASDY